METINTGNISYHYYVNHALELIVCQQTKVHELRKIGSRAVSSAEAIHQQKLKYIAQQVIISCSSINKV